MYSSRYQFFTTKTIEDQIDRSPVFADLYIVQLKEAKMATKKKSAKGTIATAFIFKKEWIFDPVPPWLRLDRAALSRINQLKTQFAKEVNAAIAKGVHPEPK